MLANARKQSAALGGSGWRLKGMAIYGLTGSTSALARACRTREVSRILRYCSKNNIPALPQGGNTSLVGGATPRGGEVIVCLGKMDRIRSLDELSGTVTVESGCVLQRLEDMVRRAQLEVPVDLGAKGTCQIGGILSTAAGGSRFMRFGPIRDHVVALEVVLADGTIVQTGAVPSHHTAGYPLSQLFVGSEGTLGVICCATLRVHRRPERESVIFLATESFPAAVRVVDEAKLRTTAAQHDQNGLTFVLLEVGGSSAVHDAELCEVFLERLTDADIIVDGTMSYEASHLGKLWKLREGVPSALRRAFGGVYKYDLSFPVAEMYDIVQEMRGYCRHHASQFRADALQGKAPLEEPIPYVTGFGHVGDGNVHLNIALPTYSRDVGVMLDDIVYNAAIRRGGSISAEHGVGICKALRMDDIHSPEVLRSMHALKAALDPKGILNPGKVLC